MRRGGARSRGRGRGEKSFIGVEFRRLRRGFGVDFFDGGVELSVGIGVRDASGTVFGLIGDPSADMSAYHALNIDALVVGGGAGVDKIDLVFLAPAAAFDWRHFHLGEQIATIKCEEDKCSRR